MTYEATLDDIGRFPTAGAPLIQAGWVIWRGRGGSAALQAWVHRLAERRGQRIAVVALARRLARIRYAMWRDDIDYRAMRAAA